MTDQPPPAVDPTPTEPGTQPGPDRTILVAEDEHVTARLIEVQLQRAGYRVAIASNGLQALRLLFTEKPLLLLLDLQMPLLSGFDVLNRLKDMAPPRPKVIVLSAESDSVDVKKALTLGANDYMVKPFNAQDLLTRVKRQLGE